MNQNNIPALRFKGFEGNEVLIKSISDLLNDGKNITYGIVQPGDYDPNGVIMIRSQDYSTGWNDLSTMYKVSREIDKPYQRSRVTKDDIIITVVGGNVGKLAVVPEYLNNSNISRAVARISIKKNLAISKYVNFFLEKKIRKLIFLNQVGGAQPVLNLKQLSRFIITCPSLPEQQKIASFLSAIDEKIKQLTRKKVLLEQYKKGVMQHLFSSKLMFKDENGKAYPKWEEKRLGDVLEIGSGRDYKHLGEGEIPVFGTGGYMLSVNEKLYSGETVFIGRKGTIDKPFYFNGDFWTVDTLFYTYKFKKVLPKFVYAIFQQVNWKLYNEASGVPSLSKSTLEQIKFRFPIVEEQQKISTYLSSIDAKIESVANQITQTQIFKKGLLQQMFV